MTSPQIKREMVSFQVDLPPSTETRYTLKNLKQSDLMVLASALFRVNDDYRATVLRREIEDLLIYGRVT